MNPSSGKKVYRSDLIGLTIFIGLFAFAGISKYGLLLAYLNASGYISIFLAGYITYKVVQKFDESLRGVENHKRARRLSFARPVISTGTFSALFYLLFFVQPDKLAIAYVKGIPVEVLYPCSYQLAPENERLAREIFQLRSGDEFNCSAADDRSDWN